MNSVVVEKNYLMERGLEAFSFMKLEALKSFKMLHSVISLRYFLWLVN